MIRRIASPAGLLLGALTLLCLPATGCKRSRLGEVEYLPPVVEGTGPADAQARDMPVRPASAGAHALVGTWRSEACGGREFPREWTLRGDGTWEGQDLVSPCPPDLTCIWSGVVLREGTWQALDASRVALVESRHTPDPAPMDLQPPTRLDRTADGVRDDLGCTWQGR